MQFVAIAVLEGYTLVFNKLSKDGTGKANIKKANDKVVGVIYRLEIWQMKVLDRYEGGYTRKSMVTNDGRLVKVYVASKNCTRKNLLPSKEYLDLIEKGREEWGLI